MSAPWRPARFSSWLRQPPAAPDSLEASADKGQRRIKGKAPSMGANYTRAMASEEVQGRWKENWLRGIRR